MLTVITERRICQDLDRNHEARTDALDISKAFGSVWNAGLLHRLRVYDVSSRIFYLVQFFLSNCEMNVA